MTENLFEKKQVLSTHQVITRLEKKYCAPSWGFFTEVKDSVGYGHRRADGIAIAMWRSLGLEIHGFEVKVSRSDWLNELKDGGKSDVIFKYCDRWWIIVGDASIVREGELPPTWGLQVPHGTGLKVDRKAPKLKPEPLTVQFVAELLRRHLKSQSRPEALQLEYERGFADGKEKATPSDLKYQIERAEKQKKVIEEFEKASGLSIYDWNAGEIGHAVKALVECGPKKIIDDLEYARSCLTRPLEEFKKAIQELEKLHGMRSVVQREGDASAEAVAHLES